MTREERFARGATLTSSFCVKRFSHRKRLAFPKIETDSVGDGESQNPKETFWPWGWEIGLPWIARVGRKGQSAASGSPGLEFPEDSPQHVALSLIPAKKLTYLRLCHFSAFQFQFWCYYIPFLFSKIQFGALPAKPSPQLPQLVHQLNYTTSGNPSVLWCLWSFIFFLKWGIIMELLGTGKNTWTRVCG